MTSDKLQLCNGQPISEDHQDVLEDLLYPFDDEKILWKKIGKSPNSMFDDVSFNPDGVFAVNSEDNTFREIINKHAKINSNEYIVDVNGLVDMLSKNYFFDYN